MSTKIQCKLNSKMYGGQESSTRCFDCFISLTDCKCSQHNQIKTLIAVSFFIWLCFEHLQRVCCQTEEVVFYLQSTLSATVKMSLQLFSHTVF